MQTTADILSRRTRILCVDDHSMILEGVTRFFEASKSGVVVAGVSRAEQVLDALEQNAVDVCLLDLFLGSKDSLWLIPKLARNSPPIPVIIFSMQHEALLFHKALSMGAAGLVHKADPPEELALAVNAARHGRKFFSTTIKLLFGTTDGLEVPVDPREKLSARELEIYRMISEGDTNSEIALTLGLSVKTVESHRENIKHKLGLKTSRDLARHARAWANPVGSPSS
jgi:two-component system nitrate/nitrite response regulator NarL